MKINDYFIKHLYLMSKKFTLVWFFKKRHSGIKDVQFNYLQIKYLV